MQLLGDRLPQQFGQLCRNGGTDLGSRPSIWFMWKRRNALQAPIQPRLATAILIWQDVCDHIMQDWRSNQARIASANEDLAGVIQRDFIVGGSSCWPSHSRLVVYSSCSPGCRNAPVAGTFRMGGFTRVSPVDDNFEPSWDLLCARFPVVCFV